jgi:4'-phosphopantetheinyl transferase EntD
MPLYKTITVNPFTKVLIWKIEESFGELSEGIDLTPRCKKKVDDMKSEIHRRGFMSVRQLLALEGYEDKDLWYDENGKPHLKDGKNISITHSFEFSAIIISDDDVGIDIEKQRPKILKIGPKFTTIEDYHHIEDDELLIRKLTIVWCAKESLYKSFARKGMSFYQHIYVEDFDPRSNETYATVNFQDKHESYHIWFNEFDGFTCAYVLLHERKHKYFE